MFLEILLHFKMDFNWTITTMTDSLSKVVDLTKLHKKDLEIYIFFTKESHRDF